jgi:hypothetical protein
MEFRELERPAGRVSPGGAVRRVTRAISVTSGAVAGPDRRSREMPAWMAAGLGGPAKSAGASRSERSVMQPGEEEQTAGGGSSGASGGGSAAPAAPVGCNCTPGSVQIKNVSSYRDGKLYGHKFDVEVELTYTKAAAGPGQDAQLLWFERTDRPPAWQGLSANVWNDMFALFPTSPTFDGWTKNRTKPCPGTETATIHDPPAASVDMPARTLEFDLYVRGQQVSHNAQAKQVLEPDGKGGVKTQTFTVLPSNAGPAAGP